MGGTSFPYSGKVGVCGRRGKELDCNGKAFALKRVVFHTGRAV
jgi:hypothetical protein